MGKISLLQAPTLEITCDDDDMFLGDYDSDGFSDDDNEYDDEEEDLLDDNQVTEHFARQKYSFFS